MRPCPWVGCRHHLGGDVTDHRAGPRWAANPRADDSGLLQFSCSLDVVSEHPQGLDRKQVAWLVGISSDRVMQIEQHAIRRLWAGDLANGGELRDAKEAFDRLQDGEAWSNAGLRTQIKDHR